MFVLLNTKEDILQKVCNQAVLGHHWFLEYEIKYYEVNGAPELLCVPQSSEYLPLCSAEQTHSYRFGNTCWWVNDDRIYTFEWTIPLCLSGTRGFFSCQLISLKHLIREVRKFREEWFWLYYFWSKRRLIMYNVSYWQEQDCTSRGLYLKHMNTTAHRRNTAVKRSFIYV